MTGDCALPFPPARGLFLLLARCGPDDVIDVPDGKRHGLLAIDVLTLNNRGNGEILVECRGRANVDDVGRRPLD